MLIRGTVFLFDESNPYASNSSEFAKPGEYRFTLKRDISFYNGPSTFEKPIVTFKKGTEVVLNPAFSNFLNPPCGLPTYERRWRFVLIGDILPDENELKRKLRSEQDIIHHPPAEDGEFDMLIDFTVTPIEEYVNRFYSYAYRRKCVWICTH